MVFFFKKKTKKIPKNKKWFFISTHVTRRRRRRSPYGRRQTSFVRRLGRRRIPHGSSRAAPVVDARLFSDQLPTASSVRLAHRVVRRACISRTRPPSTWSRGSSLGRKATTIHRRRPPSKAIFGLEKKHSNYTIYMLP